MRNIGLFDISSVLLWSLCMLQHKFRKDTRCLVEKLRLKKRINPLYEQVLRDKTDARLNDEEFDKKAGDCLNGSTMMLLEDAYELGKHCRDGDEWEVVDDKGNTLRLVPPWPSVLVACHPHDKWGARFCQMKSLVLRKTKDSETTCSSADNRLLWMMISVFASVKQLWKLLAARVTSTKDWHGWLLLFMATKILDSPGKWKSGGLFRKCLTTAELRNKMGIPDNFNPSHLVRFLGDLPRLIVVNDLDLQQDSISSDVVKEKDAIIVCRPLELAAKDLKLPSSSISAVGGSMFRTNGAGSEDKVAVLDDSAFELRFFGKTPNNKTNEDTRRGKWSCESCSRHGCKTFPYFQK